MYNIHICVISTNGLIILTFLLLFRSVNLSKFSAWIPLQTSVIWKPQFCWTVSWHCHKTDECVGAKKCFCAQLAYNIVATFRRRAGATLVQAPGNNLPPLPAPSTGKQADLVCEEKHRKWERQTYRKTVRVRQKERERGKGRVATLHNR